jgi:uncharacterized protein (DUF4415 family)
MTRKMTKSERFARDRLTYHLWQMEEDFDLDFPAVRENVPEAWHTLEADIDCFEPKEKVTLYLDKSVARVFRAMGAGYQTRINRVLASWVQLRAAGMVETERRLAERQARAFGGRDASD